MHIKAQGRNILQNLKGVILVVSCMELFLPFGKVYVLYTLCHINSGLSLSSVVTAALLLLLSYIKS